MKYKYFYRSFTLMSIFLLFSFLVFNHFFIFANIAPTGSMKPFIDENYSVLLYKKVNFDKLKVGDIISFTDHNICSLDVFHRVVSIDYDNKFLVTRGDNNLYNDKPISFNQVTGVFLFKIRNI